MKRLLKVMNTTFFKRVTALYFIRWRRLAKIKSKIYQFRKFTFPMMRRALKTWSLKGPSKEIALINHQLMFTQSMITK